MCVCRCLWVQTERNRPSGGGVMQIFLTRGSHLGVNVVKAETTLPLHNNDGVMAVRSSSAGGAPERRP